MDPQQQQQQQPQVPFVCDRSDCSIEVPLYRVRKRSSGNPGVVVGSCGIQRPPTNRCSTSREMVHTQTLACCYPCGSYGTTYTSVVSRPQHWCVIHPKSTSQTVSSLLCVVVSCSTYETFLDVFQCCAWWGDLVLLLFFVLVVEGKVGVVACGCGGGASWEDPVVILGHDNDKDDESTSVWG